MVTVTRLASSIWSSPEVVVTATLTADARSFIAALHAVTTGSCSVVKFFIEETTVSVEVAVTSHALICVPSSSSRPLPVIVQRETFATVWPCCVVFALAYKTVVRIVGCFHAVAGVTVTFTPSTNREICDGIEV